jgi:hypothetical protein
MTLEEFAKLAGVIVIECDAAQWGGGFGYTTKQYPSGRVCGCESPETAYRCWAESAFGDEAAKVLETLLSESAKIKAAARRVIRCHDVGTLSTATGDSRSIDALRKLVE